MDRLAFHYRCTPADFQRHLGTRSTGITIPDDQASNAAHLLGLDPAHVHALHLDSLVGTALPDVPTVTSMRRQSWTRLAHPRSCPACLHETGWARLAWQLPWITTCPDHDLYLADSPNDQPLPATARALQRTTHFLAVLDGHPARVLGVELAGHDVFDAWRAAIALAGQCHQLDDLPAHPTSTADCDAVLDIVGPLMRCASVEEGADLVDLWCQTGGITFPFRSALRPVRHPLLKRCVAITTQRRRHGSGAPCPRILEPRIQVSEGAP